MSSRPTATSDSQPRTGSRTRVIALAASAATAGLVLGGNALVGAYFTSEARVEGQVATATIEVDARTLDGHVPIDATGMLPGDSEVTFVEVENTGTAELSYSVRIVADVDADEELSRALMVRVMVAGGPVRNASLADWAGGRLTAAAAIAPGDTLPVLVAVELPSTAGDELQGAAAGFGVVVQAIQTANVAQPVDGWVED